ncbi:hypothetical protein PRVXH_002154 [Proteinivorax hydrogeniformans]|uniref:ABC-2 family transporter n=1 Tax=Proteinivorax hydrogeniformans TaxID=1826727 RepID=A0AAU8HRU5_9FIRM
MLNLFKLYNASFYKNIRDLVLAYGVLNFFNIAGAVLFYINLNTASSVSEMWFKGFFSFLTLHLFCVSIAPSNLLDHNHAQNWTKNAASGVLENILPVTRKVFLLNRVLVTLCTTVIMGLLLLLPFLIAAILLQIKGIGDGINFLKALLSMQVLVIIGGLILCMLTILYKKGRGVLTLGYSIYSVIVFLMIRGELLLNGSMLLLAPLFMLIVTYILYKYTARNIYEIDICQ